MHIEGVKLQIIAPKQTTLVILHRSLEGGPSRAGVRGAIKPWETLALSFCSAIFSTGLHPSDVTVGVQDDHSSFGSHTSHLRRPEGRQEKDEEGSLPNKSVTFKQKAHI